MKTFVKTILFASALMCGISASAADKYKYTNPVFGRDFPDPTIIRDGKYFYAYHTGSKVPVAKSPNLHQWAHVGNCFTESTRPRFVEGGGVWAPDINKIGDKFVMYYSMSTWGGEWACGIGVATSNIAYADFKDHGKLFISSEIGVQNSIDPFYFEEEDGSKYLFWGSFRGIYGIELSADGLSIKEGATKFKVAGTLTEGTYIHKRDGYYYMIGSAGSCCEKERSTYRMVVARSKSLKGPYVSKNGRSALDNSFSPLLDADKEYAYGTGHCSEIVTDDAGQDWILFHAYKASNVDDGRCLYLEQVKWDSEGWPYIVGGKNHDEWDRPVFGNSPFTYSDVEYIDYQGGDETYKYLFDTGLVPTKATRVEVDCYSYDKNANDEPFAGRWRAVFSGRDSNRNGISLYVNQQGNQWGYFVGGYVNDFVGTHEFNKRYTVSASLAELTVNGETTATNRTTYSTTGQRLCLFTGQQDYPYYGRIYGMKIYGEDSELIHDFVPCVRNEDEMPVFYDKVTKTYIRPNTPDGFGTGNVVNAIKNVTGESMHYAHDTGYHDLQGRRIDKPSTRGIYIKDGRKIVIE